MGSDRGGIHIESRGVDVAAKSDNLPVRGGENPLGPVGRGCQQRRSANLLCWGEVPNG